MKSKQHGVSFLGILFVGGFLAYIGAMGALVAPTFFEYEAIKKALNKATQGATTVAEVRQAFDKATLVDDIKSISGKDLEITKEDYKIVASFAYNKEVNMTGPVFLLIKYSGKSYKTGSAN
jgi:Domain of unknown function (DUF4845)